MIPPSFSLDFAWTDAFKRIDVVIEAGIRHCRRGVRVQQSKGNQVIELIRVRKKRLRVVINDMDGSGEAYGFSGWRSLPTAIMAGSISTAVMASTLWRRAPAASLPVPDPTIKAARIGRSKAGEAATDSTRVDFQGILKGPPQYDSELRSMIAWYPVLFTSTISSNFSINIMAGQPVFDKETRSR